MDENDYEVFFNNFRQLKETQRKQKQRGLNDFNLLTTVLKYSDEVRLHSRMIGHLLNPNGKHYQETVFLEKFLKVVKLDNWGLDLANTKVYIEYKDIDLYITDGNKHIIIENKIWAEDQPCQIMKYINIIVEENKESIDFANKVGEHIILDENTIQVLYLTPRTIKLAPSAHKKDNNGYIYFKGEKDANDELLRCSKKSNTKLHVPNGLKKYKAKYQQITYRDIIDWLDKSKHEVSNITNLNEAIQQYMDVVKQVNGDYRGRVMELKEYIKEHNMELETLFDVRNDIEKLQGNLLYDFFWKEIDDVVKVNDEIKKTKDNYKYFIYKRETCRKWFLDIDKDFGSFYKINDHYLLYIAIGIKNIHYGIVKHNDFEMIDASEDEKSYGLTYRNKGWRGLKWFSEGMPLINNLDLLNKDKYEKSTFATKINQLIKQIKERENNE